MAAYENLAMAIDDLNNAFDEIKEQLPSSTREGAILRALAQQILQDLPQICTHADILPLVRSFGGSAASVEAFQSEYEELSGL